MAFWAEGKRLSGVLVPCAKGKRLNGVFVASLFSGKSGEFVLFPVFSVNLGCKRVDPFGIGNFHSKGEAVGLFAGATPTREPNKTGREASLAATARPGCLNESSGSTRPEYD